MTPLGFSYESTCPIFEKFCLGANRFIYGKILLYFSYDKEK